MNALKTKPWALLALVSIALNLFLGGLLVGKLLRPERPSCDTRPIALIRSSRGLDPEARAIVQRAQEKHHRGIRHSMGQVGKSRLAAIDALCGKDFDEAKVRQAFVAYSKEASVSQDEMHEALIDAAKQMTPEQREGFREALTRDRGREKNWGRMRGPKGAFSAGPLD